MNGRHLARRNAVQALYQWEITQQDAAKIASSFILDERLEGRYLDYFNKLIKEIPINIEVIDSLINTYISRPMSRVDPLEKSILRVGAYELQFELDMPNNVVINEAIEMAKVFCSDEGYKFVNGVLDQIKTAQAVESTEAKPGSNESGHG